MQVQQQIQQQIQQQMLSNPRCNNLRPWSGRYANVDRVPPSQPASFRSVVVEALAALPLERRHLLLELLRSCPLTTSPDSSTESQLLAKHLSAMFVTPKKNARGEYEETHNNSSDYDEGYTRREVGWDAAVQKFKTTLSDLVKQALEQPLQAHEPVPAVSPPAVSDAAPAASTSTPSAGTPSSSPALSVRVIPEFSQYGSAALPEVRLTVSVKAVKEVVKQAAVGLTCVLDRSGSMSGPRIALVKATSQFIIDQTGPGDALSFVTYSSDVRVDLPLTLMSPAAKAFAHSTVQRIRADGGTALFDGLMSGMKGQMESLVQDSKRVSAVFLCTDGQANEGPQTADEILPRLTSLQKTVSSPLVVHTFGFGHGHSAELLEAIAEAQSGTYYYIATPDDIPQGFGDALGGLLSVVAKNIKLRVEAEGGVQIKELLSGGRKSGAAADTSSASFADMYAEESRECLLKVSVPAAEVAAGGAAAATPVLRVHMEYTDPVSGAVVKEVVPVSISRVMGEVPAGEQVPDETVLATMARFATVKALSEAEKLEEAGKLKEAAAVLSSHKAVLQGYKQSRQASEGLKVTLGVYEAQTKMVEEHMQPQMQVGSAGAMSKAIKKAAQTSMMSQRAANAGVQASLPTAAMYDNSTRSKTRQTASTMAAPHYQR